MEEVIQSVMRLLSGVSGLKYIDKDWGQLDQTPPAVKWPCALVDFQAVEFTGTGGGGQRARATIVITLANQRTVRTSVRSPRREGQTELLRLIDDIHAALQYRTGDGVHTELNRTMLSRDTAESSNESYAIMYQCSFLVPSPRGVSAM
jgi:hypothetical protein